MILNKYNKIFKKYHKVMNKMLIKDILIQKIKVQKRKGKMQKHPPRVQWEIRAN